MFENVGKGGGQSFQQSSFGGVTNYGFVDGLKNKTDNQPFGISIKLKILDMFG